MSKKKAAKYITEGSYTPAKIETQAFIKPATLNQQRYVKSLLGNTVTLAHGVAGVGKSLLALHTGVCLINSPKSDIERIVYVRANVGVREEKDIGAVPGELIDKAMMLSYPIVDNLSEFMQQGQIKALFEYGKIQVFPISLLRGRSLANTFLIVDEAQNLSLHGIKTATSRISHGSKLVLMGDCGQSDLKGYDGLLGRLCDVMQGAPDVGVVRFVEEDIVRHPILAELMKRLERL